MRGFGNRSPSWLAGLILGWCAFVPQSLQAAVRTETVEYQHGTTLLEGYLAYDDAVIGARSAVLVVHEWNGLGPYAKRRAEQLAQLGYFALAVDMYGKGIRPRDHEEAAAVSGVYRKDRQLMRSRIAAALDVVKRHPLVDPDRIAAIGYCFGGAAALELARSGADVVGVVSFHGALDTPNPADAANIRGKVLVLHGANDPHVTQEQVETFRKEMEQAGVDYRIVQYPGVMHSFTVPDAGNDPSSGVAYNEAADRESWEVMKAFLEDVFRVSPLRRMGRSSQRTRQS